MERESCSQLYDVEQDSRFGRHAGGEAKRFHPKRSCSSPALSLSKGASSPPAVVRQAHTVLEPDRISRVLLAPILAPQLVWNIALVPHADQDAAALRLAASIADLLLRD